jgi:hypothetical protein
MVAGETVYHNTRGLSWRKVRKVLKRRRNLGMIIMGRDEWVWRWQELQHDASFSHSDYSLA